MGLNCGRVRGRRERNGRKKGRKKEKEERGAKKRRNIEGPAGEQGSG